MTETEGIGVASCIATFCAKRTLSRQFDSLNRLNQQLTAVSEATTFYRGSTTWTYDQLGRATSKTQTVGTAVLAVQYGYDAQGHLDSMIYPDGTILSYNHDAAGRINGAGALGSRLALPHFAQSGL